MSFFGEFLASVLPTVSYADSEEEEEEEQPVEVVEVEVEVEEEEEEEEEDEEDEDDEDEEEAEDPLDKLRAECTTTSECAKYVHHYQECVERVTKEQEEEGYAEKSYKEDCIEEFFHLQHCINDCAAPKLFYKLK
ncbi:ubiquinol--cytochrome-c reductase subunit 6 [Saccharomycopsis crataegensis]|uniref:Cytochrome b-c1 complex subunit 6, mitochondrial n=1 Tax=Saccharomycopsis crataegensis TaxID=43959 RepID=A0AAV5QR17_9ASCO|nr:ubiquinol--cytochrome-c reductase subunit 6 [Saccharomycopsis crataegensis]